MLQLDKCALAIVDVQKGFDDLSYRSPTCGRNSPARNAFEPAALDAMSGRGIQTNHCVQTQAAT
jgi:nicotinamidase-related amidase